MPVPMKKIFSKIETLEFKPHYVPWALLIIAVLAYGLFVFQAGFYWDDFPISWIRYQMGPDAQRQYFSTSRPVWGMLHRLTTSVFPQVPVYWQAFALVWRWLGAVVLWQILRVLWPHRRRLAFLGSALFLLYPGQNQQWVSYLISHFFIVLFFFLFSYLLTLWSLLYPKWGVALTLGAMLFCALNVWMMEYFFALELFRPFVIFFFLTVRAPANPPRPFWRNVLEALKRWLPYLAVFIANILYRSLVFSNLAYENVLLEDLKARPLETLGALTVKAAGDLWTVSARAWAQVFRFPAPANDGLRVTLLFAAVVVSTAALVVLFRARGEGTDRRAAAWAAGLGLIAMLAGGGPYWLAKLDISLGFPANRFAISFMLGVSLFMAGLIELMPARLRLALAALLIALAAGRQFLWADDFVREWNWLKTMFWQMTWRAPGLEPYTTILLNDRALLSPAATGALPPEDLRVFDYYADNSIAAALNWVYDPDNHTREIRYLLLYPKSRLGGSLPALQPGLPIRFDYLIDKFEGNTSRVAAFYYAPPACLRLLDPEIDALNRFIPDETLMREAAALSSPAWITREKTARLPEVFGSEPPRGWCYYFEQADLARQQRNWEEVVRLGEIALALGDHPNDPVERFVFIEGYAHNGNWARAQELSIESFRVSKEYVGPMLCRLWARIARETTVDAEQTAAIEAMRAKFSCSW